MEIAKNIYRLNIPLPDKRLSILHSYLLKSEDGCMLIDTGWNTDEAYQALLNQLAELDVTPADLKYIFITHLHPDHYGLVGRLSKISDASVIQHKIEYNILSQRHSETEKTVAEFEDWLKRNGLPPSTNKELQSITMEVFRLGNNGASMQLVKGGERIQMGDFDLEVIWTPGHSPGLICLFDHNQKIFFSADHVLPHTTPNISLFFDDGSNPLADYLQSLRKVADLPARLTLPAHGDSIKDLASRVDEMLGHHEERLEEILSACEEEPLTAYQIAASIKWSIATWDKLPAFHQRFALLETLAHLEFLRSRGLLVLEEIQGNRKYLKVEQQKRK